MTDAVERAAREEAAGRTWRAKEILRGNIGQSPYTPKLYVAYGELLLRLGENDEAGKYLLLAGSSQPAHQPAIDLFLRRHGSSPRQLFSRFPTQARRVGLDHFPTRVQELLSGFVLSERYPPEPMEPKSLRKRVKDKLTLVTCGVVAFVVIGIFLMGIYTLLRWFKGA
jgi:hypothetical protein